MFLTFLFRSAPEEGLYCKPKYRAKKIVFLKNKYISVILAFVVCSLKLVTSAVGISLPLIFSNARFPRTENVEQCPTNTRGREGGGGVGSTAQIQ